MLQTSPLPRCGAALLLATAVFLAGCSSDPAQKRTADIDTIAEGLRSELSLNDAQVDCFRSGLAALTDSELAQAAAGEPSPEVSDRIIAIGVTCYLPPQ